MNTLSMFDILEYPWLFIIYNKFIISYLDCMACFQMRWLLIYYVGKYYLVHHRSLWTLSYTIWLFPKFLFFMEMSSKICTKKGRFHFMSFYSSQILNSKKKSRLRKFFQKKIDTGSVMSIYIIGPISNNDLKLSFEVARNMQ